MKAAFSPRRFSFVLGVMLLAGAARPVFAQTPDYVLQTFDYGICGWSSISPAALAFDPTQDDTGNGGGSCHVSFPISEDGVFIINASYVSCCNCELELLLVLTNYASVDFDVKWDNTSTIIPDQFNSNSGLVIEAMNGSVCYNNVYIPNSATSGWAHVSTPINPASHSSGSSIGISLVKTFAASGSGTAAFWLDDVKLVGLKPPRFVPAMSHRSGNKFTLQWTANPGSTCTVHKSTDLVHWSTLVTGYPAGGLTTGTASYTDAIATNSQPSIASAFRDGLRVGNP